MATFHRAAIVPSGAVGPHTGSTCYRTRVLADDLRDCEEALRALGRPARVTETTASTNDDARGWASEGAVHGSVVVADAQTGGRGRHGRAWSCPPRATLAMSVIVRPPLEPAALAPIALVAGLAVRDAVARRVTGAEIKWPNDVVITRASSAGSSPETQEKREELGRRGGRTARKIAGVLVEAAITGGRVEHVVIGVGVNVDRASFPTELAQTATSIALAAEEDSACGRSPRAALPGWRLDRTALAIDVLRALDAELASFLARPERLVERFATHDALRGRRVRVGGAVGGRIDDRGGTYEGVANGIGADGRLRVVRDDGAVAFALAGEVALVPVGGSLALPRD